MTDLDFKELKDLLCKWWDELPRKKENPIVTELKEIKIKLQEIRKEGKDDCETFKRYRTTFENYYAVFVQIFQKAEARSEIEKNSNYICRLLKVIVDNRMYTIFVNRALFCLLEHLKNLIEAIEND